MSIWVLYKYFLFLQGLLYPYIDSILQCLVLKNGLLYFDNVILWGKVHQVTVFAKIVETTPPIVLDSWFLSLPQGGNEDIASDCTKKFLALNLSDDVLFSVTTNTYVYVYVYRWAAKRTHDYAYRFFDFFFNVDLLKIFVW